MTDPPTDRLPTDRLLSDRLLSDRLLSDPAVQRVRAAIADHLVATTFVVLDGPLAARRAAQLDISTAQIVGSLLFAARRPSQHPDGDGPTPLLVLTSSAHQVDTVKVAAAFELGEVTPADVEFVRRTTGFVVGGIAPVGHPRPVRTVVDVTLARYDTIWAPAGHPRVAFRTTYDELIRMSGGLPTEVV